MYYLILVFIVLIAIVHATIQTSLQQLPHLSSFTLTPLLYTPSTTISDPLYYNERIVSSNLFISKNASTMTSIDLNNKTIKTETNLTPTIALSADFTSYHPTDQIWLCYYSTFHLHNQPIPQSPPFHFTSASQQPLTIPASLVPTFLSCCPTIYSPFPQQPHYSRTTTSSESFTQDLILTPPFFNNLQRAGCGHAHVIDHNDITTGTQNDQYPRQIYHQNYRNTPDNWYYNPQSPHSTSKTYIYTRFQLSNDIFDNKSNQEVSYTQSITKTTSSTTSVSVSKFGTSTLVKCDKKQISQSGEGYRRTIEFTYDLSTCNASATLSTSTSTPTSTSTSTPTSTSATSTTLTASAETPLTPSTDQHCQYIFMNYLPTSLFLDPYPITYTLLAEANSKQRDTSLIAPFVSPSQSNLADQSTSSIKKLQTSDFGWFLYNFIDVEAQTNNAGGNLLATTLPLKDYKNETIQLQFPLLQRYSASQLSTAQISLSDFFNNVLNPTNVEELRYSSDFFEPIIIQHCSPTGLSNDVSKLPTTSTVFNIIRQHDKSISQLSNLNLTVPVGTLNMLPIVTFFSLSVLLATGIALHYIFWKHIKREPISAFKS